MYRSITSAMVIRSSLLAGSWESSKAASLTQAKASALVSKVADEELTEERRQAGAVVESGVMTIISEEEFFTNFPEPFVAE
jgi:hypothetical protein